MNQIEREFFVALHEDRTDSANTFEKPSTREMWRSIVEKYSDQAHFIYELIQNADDAGATNARFVLQPNQLIFAHNGTRHFSITNPANEDMDSREGHLGDINSITGIAFSNKKNQGNKIGKFGVGFKAVFQYTASPRIYDPEFRFQIDRYIVPTELEHDFPDRKPEETLFVFPFDHKDRNPQETYSDIEGKLKALSYPILFLSNLLYITYEIDDVIGLYEKSITETHEYCNDTLAERICLMQNYGDDIVSRYLWLFTRHIDGHRYSVGYFVSKDNHLIPTNEPAFCYFPTKETTGLSFIVHAPFLLTDSREGIRAGVAHNNNLILLLAKLAADSLLHLRDISESRNCRLIGDDIFSIIPINENAFCNLDDPSRISFKPFFTEIKRVFETERIIPTRAGFTVTKNAYWAAVPYLAELFNDEQLAALCGNQDAKWVFVSLGRDEVQRNNKILFAYIDSIVFTGLSEQHLIRGRYQGYYTRTKDIMGITPEFTENQSIDWLFSLYKWLSETSERTKLARTAPIFLDQASKAAAAFDEKEHMLVFLPSQDIPNCKTIRVDILKNPDATELITKLGVTYPSIRDEIYNVIIPQYKKGGNIDTDTHFRLFFKYYRQCPQEEIEDFINEIRNCEFVTYTTQASPQLQRGKAAELYMPSSDLCDFFECKNTTPFVAYDEYLSLVGSSKEKYLKSFLFDLGVRQSIKIHTREIEWAEQNIRTDLPTPRSSSFRRYYEKYIDGCKELVNYIVENKSVSKSVLLWNQLLNITSTIGYGGLEFQLHGTCSYFYYSSKTTRFTASDATLLKTAAWLMNTDGEFVPPNKLTLTTISNQYTVVNDYAESLMKFLCIAAEEVPPEEDTTNLTDAQRQKVELGDFVLAQGLTKEDLEELVRIKQARQLQRELSSENTSPSSHGEQFKEPYVDDLSNDEDEVYKQSTQTSSEKPLRQNTSQVAKDILSRTKKNLSAYNDGMNDYDDADADEYTPSPVNFSRKVELEKEKAAKAIEQIAYQEELQQRALDANKYSYGWFKALLELEALNSNTNNLSSKEISISFAHVEREPDTQRTLVLKHPNRYIPQFMEDLTDIPLVLKFGDQTKTLAIEVANVKSYTLRVKLKSHVDISNLDFKKITEARIDAKSPVFLLEELKKQFGALDYEDSFDMQENLCENIEFVFGPPGTGKTTHLAKNVLIPLMRSEEEPKVLVLTPTNKAADVLVRRVMEVMQNDTSYYDWLVRFGGTGDEIVEQSGICRDKTFDIRKLSKNVTITTIARFPYDFFMPKHERIFLHGINWDYIVIDEASMIPLVNIIFPLYKKTPKKFIIAGDPFQIEPITSVDLWKDENIYTLVHLDSFIEPHTIPHDYHVELLTTQYRSVPSVGSVFSKFAYGGILEHHRTETSRRKLNIDLGFPIDALNIIKFPVSKYESIYRSKRLQHSSSYQVYSALFTFEFAVHFAKKLAVANPKNFFRIGIIAPYRAQSDLIERLICSEKLPVEVDIQVGTIHGFQGDECDIIFAVFNTPPSITSGHNMFLNKRNIINVSISRAKDYLFIIMPDNNTENIHNLRLVKRVEQLIKNSGSFTDNTTPELEDLIFGSSTYLEDNAFSTGHQSVNVYGMPEKLYEVRSEDSAVDIQIHRHTKPDVKSKSSAPGTDGTIQIIGAPEVGSNNFVVSPKYGTGKIVKRFTSFEKTWITVKYSHAEISYDEELAFKSNALYYKAP